MSNCFTEILRLVCTENGITAVRSNKLITSQCLKKNCDMKDEVIDLQHLKWRILPSILQQKLIDRCCVKVCD